MAERHDHGLEVETRRGVAWLRMNRAARLNALDAATMEAMSRALESAGADGSVRSIVLIGAGGRAFSTGGDLKQLRADEAAGDGLRAERAAARLYDLLRSSAKPLIAAVDGYCLAAGFEIAILCDMIVATRQSQFGLSEVRFSLMPDAGLVELPQRVPAGIAKQLLLTGLPIPAERAFQLGLVTQLCADRAAMLRDVEALTSSIALAAPLAVQAYKRVIDAAQAAGMTAARRLRDAAWAEISRSEDRQEGLDAFVEKRPPVWKGR